MTWHCRSRFWDVIFSTIRTWYIVDFRTLLLPNPVSRVHCLNQRPIIPGTVPGLQRSLWMTSRTFRVECAQPTFFATSLSLAMKSSFPECREPPKSASCFATEGHALPLSSLPHQMRQSLPQVVMHFLRQQIYFSCVASRFRMPLYILDIVSIEVLSSSVCEGKPARASSMPS